MLGRQPSFFDLVVFKDFLALGRCNTILIPLSAERWVHTATFSARVSEAARTGRVESIVALRDGTVSAQDEERDHQMEERVSLDASVAVFYVNGPFYVNDPHRLSDFSWFET